MAAAALLSITLVPVLMLLFIRGKVMPEKKNPINRFLIWIYRPIIDLVLRYRVVTIVIAGRDPRSSPGSRHRGSGPSSCRR